MTTAVLTMVRRRPGAVASSAESFLADGCMSMAWVTAISISSPMLTAAD